MLGYKEITLKDNEFTTQWYSIVKDEDINNFVKNNSSLNINGEALKISNNSNYKDTIGEGFYTNSDCILILPDEVCDDLVVKETNFLFNLKSDMSYEEINDFQNNYIYDWFRSNNNEFVKKYSTADYDATYSVIDIRIKEAEVNNILNITLAMRILGIYLGVVLLMISLTILSLSQLIDSVEHKDRFNVIRKLGVEDREVNKIILKQISIYFIVPIVIGIVGAAIFVYDYYLFYEEVIKTYVGDKAFILSIAVGINTMISVYICYFGGTYYTFKRNINTN